MYNQLNAHCLLSHTKRIDSRLIYLLIHGA